MVEGLSVGFDSLFFGQIDYQDKAKQKGDKNLEVIWRASKRLGSSSQIFASAFPQEYAPPPGDFNFESIGVDLDGVRKDHQAIKAKLKILETEKEAINNVIASLEEELCVVIEKKDKAYHKISELRNKREEENTCFYQNRSLLNDARRLAASKDVNALIELSTSEVC
ncbi:proton pump-interactor 1-like [Helianthus annuus]|uniref:proton pump-interactor 1-like n=1 Tax=Helianthus annuus TaxID=4232 RepID=UPI0016531CF5|nr:proton pump-interactor 1-like [Helianthus annuus]